jgi:hypothetical protein
VAGIVGFLGLMIGEILCARANEALHIAGLGGVPTDFDCELVARGWTRL